MGRWDGLTPEIRFWAKVDKSGECWLWTGATRNGYGHFRMPEGPVYAHRLSLSWALGRPLAPGMEACHRCDVSACVRPDHLFEGTRADNAKDMGRKRRSGWNVHPELIARGEEWHRRHPPKPCIAGHANVPENRDSLGRCRECANRRSREYHRRRFGWAARG